MVLPFLLFCFVSSEGGRLLPLSPSIYQRRFTTTSDLRTKRVECAVSNT